MSHQHDSSSSAKSGPPVDPTASSSGGSSSSASERVPLSLNNMDDPAHETLYATGLAMRKRVVGEDYVAAALEKGSSDFLRPWQQLATVYSPFFLSGLGFPT
jgi:4-carboxymuconolactone decarboxylase